MREIKKIAVAGAGTMGLSIAEIYAKYGYDVVVYDVIEAALERAKEVIKINHQTEIKEGFFTAEESEKIQARIAYTTDIKDFKDVDFVIEAIVEKLEIKHSFWGEVSSVVDSDVIMVSNTSGLSITKIAEAVSNPERFGGMHWINPPHIIPLIEVIKGEKTSDETAKVVYDMSVKVDRKPVIVKDAPGFALNRIQFAIMRECLHIVDQGIASPEDVDKVMKYALGLRYACLGPFEVADHGGLDIFYNISDYLFEDLCDAKKPFGLLKEARDNENFGVKSGKGFYDYSDGKDKEAILYRDEMYTKVSKTLFG